MPPGAIYELGNVHAEAATRTTLGYLEYELGELAEGAETFTRLLAASREYGQAELAPQ